MPLGPRPAPLPATEDDTSRTPAQGPRAARPEFTLLICTRDRGPQLGRCLGAVAGVRSGRPWEVVVVDNGSSDDTPALLDQFARSSLVPVTVVREDRPGLGRARNAGVAVARGNVLVFIDDDCYPAADFIDRWADVFAREGVAWAAGRILPYDPDDSPVTTSYVDEDVPLAPGDFIAPGMVQGANMAFRREVVEALGGFDPDLGPGGEFNFEDLDMSSRALAAGYAGGFFVAPTVHHHHGRRAGPAVAALRLSYAHGRGAYFGSLLLRHGPRVRALWNWRAIFGGETRAERLAVLQGLLHYVRYWARNPRASGAGGAADARRDVARE